MNQRRRGTIHNSLSLSSSKSHSHEEYEETLSPTQKGKRRALPFSKQFKQLTREPKLFLTLRIRECQRQMKSMHWREAWRTTRIRAALGCIMSWLLFNRLFGHTGSILPDEPPYLSRSVINRRDLVLKPQTIPIHIQSIAHSTHSKFPSIDTIDDKIPDPYDYGEEWDERPDYGGLELVATDERTLMPTKLERVRKHYRIGSSKNRNDSLKHGSGSSQNATQKEEEEEEEEEAGDCAPVAWAEMYSPSCNSIHEFDLARDGNGEEYESLYLAHGYYRDVWVLDKNLVGSTTTKQEDMVVKTLRYKHKFKQRAFDEILIDALVMERLTGSPRIMNIYGHCGFTVTAETIEGEMEELIVPGEGVAKQADLDKEEELIPRNNYTIMEKLEIALTMAESIADLHGFRDGLIIHDDIQLCQWLRRSGTGQLVLGDFNRATIPKWSEEKQKYCKFNNGYGFGEYRAPEEFAARDLDEKIDVFSFGNNIYGLLTGLWVFYDIEDDDVKQKKIIAGERAYIDERYRNRSYIEDRLIDVMEQCWEYDPDKRIDIFQAVRLLREALETSKRYMMEEQGQ